MSDEISIQASGARAACRYPYPSKDEARGIAGWFERSCNLLVVHHNPVVEVDGQPGVLAVASIYTTDQTPLGMVTYWRPLIQMADVGGWLDGPMLNPPS